MLGVVAHNLGDNPGPVVHVHENNGADGQSDDAAGQPRRAKGQGSKVDLALVVAAPSDLRLPRVEWPRLLLVPQKYQKGSDRAGTGASTV